tara:strand:- start:1937 stop:2356 length:420 start_codon:yes stop_codon:yes gene_type:complete
MPSRSEKFKWLVDNKPEPGMVLTAKDKSAVIVHVERKPGEGGGYVLMMFANALIDPDCTGWYLTNEDTPKALKVLVLPESQDALIDSHGGRLNSLTVGALRVVRHNERGTALICELVDLDNPLIYDERDIDPRLSNGDY